MPPAPPLSCGISLSPWLITSFSPMMLFAIDVTAAFIVHYAATPLCRRRFHAPLPFFAAAADFVICHIECCAVVTQWPEPHATARLRLSPSAILFFAPLPFLRVMSLFFTLRCRYAFAAAIDAATIRYRYVLRCLMLAGALYYAITPLMPRCCLRRYHCC